MQLLSEFTYLWRLNVLRRWFVTELLLINWLSCIVNEIVLLWSSHSILISLKLCLVALNLLFYQIIWLRRILWKSRISELILLHDHWVFNFLDTWLIYVQVLLSRMPRNRERFWFFRIKNLIMSIYIWILNLWVWVLIIIFKVWRRWWRVTLRILNTW